MHPHLIVEVHRARYDDFLRQAVGTRSGRRRAPRTRIFRKRR